MKLMKVGGTCLAQEVPRLGVELELQLPAYATAHSNAGSKPYL